MQQSKYNSVEKEIKSSNKEKLKQFLVTKGCCAYLHGEKSFQLEKMRHAGDARIHFVKIRICNLYKIKYSGLSEVKNTCQISRYFHMKKQTNSETCFLVQLKAA